MKKNLLFIAIVFITISSSAQKYWVEASVSPSLDKEKNYKVAILPVISSNDELNGDEKLKNLAYEKISLQVSSIRHFEPVSRQKVEKAVRVFAFGGSSEVKEENYSQIAKEAGAKMILLCELTREKVIKKILFSKKGIEVIRVSIKIYDTTQGNSIVYNAKARSKNPLSKEAEVEYGIENAMEKLEDVME